MDIKLTSILTDVELTSASLGELDLVAEAVAVMFHNLKGYQKEHNVKIGNVSIETSYTKLGIEITIQGRTRPNE